MRYITIGGEEKKYAEGTSYLQIAQEYQPLYENDIILVSVDGKLRELYKTVDRDCALEFVTTAQKPGMQAYQRTAKLIMLKAFFDIIGRERIKKITVDFSVGKGLFVEAEGDFELTGELLDRVKKKMREYVSQEIPVMKRSVNTDEAVALFESRGMYDKASLFKYRMASRVNLYSIGGFEDYFYGYMAQNTGYIRYFDLVPFEHGFVLLLPTMAEPRKVPDFVPSRKLFEVLKESSRWGQRLGVPNVGTLNNEIAKGNANDLILIQEALQEKKIGQIAEMIAEQKEKKFVMIAGPSSSGKTTFSHRLCIQLRALGLKPHAIGVDDYFVNREDSPRDAQGNYNYEILECLDIRQFNQDMTDLLAGKTVNMPHYNFITGMREYKGDKLTLGAEDILVIEGIHCLNDKLSHTLPRDSKFKIYISALTQLNVDEHNRIPTTDGRLIRRMVRDARTRGATAQDTIRRWSSVRRGEEENIFPYQEDADVMFNSALVYELAVLKQYAQPLLFQIPKDCPEYVEAKRLLKFLDYFLGISSENIPHNSIVREFVGGSCFKV
ncbi:MAG: nucleoside kinase [Hungatella sp.]|jgi:uridine kinase|nr:nucleoside kinase [Hungatella sp.]MCI9501142.1 nucleoside kinase [Hungatella sp.]MCI9635900.1 nucleoside kinase [Hungatella sp.]